MNLDILKNIPQYQKVLIFLLVILIITGGFFYFVYIPKNSRITTLQNEIANLNKEITSNKTKLRRLDELKAENEILQRRLLELREQLPSEADAAALLKQVSELGVQTGLDFKSWKPSAIKQGTSGLYMELPVNVEVEGSYLNLAMFFYRIGKFQRIVNIAGLKMESPKIVRNKIHIKADFIATAYSAVDSAAKKDEGKKDAGAKKPQPKKK